MQCQFCGNQFSPRIFNQHVNQTCPSRPSDDVKNLPVFDLPPSFKWADRSDLKEDSFRPAPFTEDQPMPMDQPAVIPPQPSTLTQSLSADEDQQALLKSRIALAFGSAEPMIPDVKEPTSAPADVCAEAFRTYWSNEHGGHGDTTMSSEDYSRRIHSREAALACTYCGLTFANYEYAQRIMHQRVCEKNPTHEQRCCFCDLPFTTNFENLATELVADHEDLCAKNPVNICKYCSQGFGGISANTTPQKLRYKLEMHMLVCASRPSNFTQCGYCGQPMMPTFACSADEQLERHLRICTENPRHACRFCGQKFIGTLFPPENSPLVRRRNHEFDCPIRRSASDRRRTKREEWSAGGDRREENKRYQKFASELPRASSRKNQMSEWGDKDYGSVQREKSKILREYEACRPQDRRAFLRAQQLKWHPDRRIGQNTQMTNSVFCLVQKLWDDHQL